MREINFKYLRSLSEKTTKTRPSLHALHVKDEYAYWTNSNILLRIGGYTHTPDGTYDLDNFKVLNGGYPDLSNIINSKETVKPEYTATVYKNQVVYSFEDVTFSGVPRTLAISTEMINHIEKLIKGYKFNLSDVTVHGSALRITFDGTNANGLLLIFMPLNISKI